MSPAPPGGAEAAGSSWRYRATSWIPTGNPPGPAPAGTVTAGVRSMVQSAWKRGASGVTEPRRRLAVDDRREKDVAVAEGRVAHAILQASMRRRASSYSDRGDREAVFDGLLHSRRDPVAIAGPGVPQRRCPFDGIDRAANPRELPELAGKFRFRDPRPGGLEPAGGILDGAPGFRLRFVPQPGPDKADCRRPGGGNDGSGVPAGQHRSRESEIVDRPCVKAERVEAGRRGKHAGEAERPETRLVAENAAIGRGADDRPAGLGAERNRHHPVGHRGKRSRSTILPGCVPGHADWRSCRA